MNLNELKSKYELQGLEVFNQENSNYELAFVANKLKKTEIDHSKGISVRLIKDGKIGIATSFGNDDVDLLVQSAVDTSKYYPKSKLILPKGIIKREEKNSFNDESQFLEITKNKGKEIIDYILDKTKSINLLIDLSFDFTGSRGHVLSSEGLDYDYLSKEMTFVLNFRETLGSEFLDIFTASTEENFKAIMPYVDEAIAFYHYSKKSVPIKSGSFPILFTSKAAKELFDFVESAIDGKQVIEKASPWTDKLGKKILSEKLTLKQDPTFGHMARSIDDEGVEVSPLLLVENGILNSFYFDLLVASKSAGKYKSTGNGFKPSLSTQAQPGLLNMISSCGNRSREEIIKDIDYGLIVDQTMGGLSANISGDLSINIDLGFLVEKGEIVGRVKDTMVSGNAYHALNNIIELSNNPRWYWSSIYNPDLLLDGLTIIS